MKNDDLKRKCLNQHRKKPIFKCLERCFRAEIPIRKIRDPIVLAANLLEISLSLRKKLYAFLAVVCRS